MKIAGVRVIQADIPVERPHKMSFTTLEAVNFVFVRLETADGLAGWGEAACLGGPTWSEESSESIAATIERYIVPWLVGRDASGIEVLSREMARQGPPLGTVLADAAFRCTACSAAACATACRCRGRWPWPIPTQRSRRRGPRSRSATGSSRSRRPRAPWRRMSSECAGFGRRSARTSPFAWTPIRAGTGRRHCAPSGLWSPMAWTSSSSRFRAGTSRVWPRSAGASPRRSWPTNRASRPRTR